MKLKFDYVTTVGSLCLAISIAVLAGWAFDIQTLKSIFPGYITMKANTALAFGLTAIVLLLHRKTEKWAETVSFLLCGVVIAIGAATLFQYLTGVNLGIDELLVADEESAVLKFPPGRLAPITAVNFICLSLSFALARFEIRIFKQIGQLLASLVFFASFQGLVGYVIGLSYLFGSAFYTQMAVHTALCFALLSTAKLLVTPESVFFRGMTAEGATAKMTRWMLLAAMLVPPMMQLAATRGFEAGLYDRDFSQLIQIVGVTSVMAFIIISTGVALFLGEGKLSEQQRSLQENEQKFRALIDVSAQIVWTATAAGEIIEDSPSWRKYTGQTYEEWKGLGWVNALHPHDQGRAAHAWQVATKTRSTYHVEYRVRHHSGDWRWTSARGTALLNRDGSIRGWVGMNSDINERKLIELDLKNAKEEAERANELKSIFLANMSHEIRTPLSAMVGFTDILRSGDLSESERRASLETIARNGAHLSVIVNDILDLSKIESGKLVFEYAVSYPAAIVKDVLSMLDTAAQSKMLTMKCTVETSAPAHLTIDPVRVKQILVNVIGNAIKFTNSGHIDITIREWIRNGTAAGVTFEVEDTGIGILESQKNFVFEVFTQADASMTRRFGGTGLGLSLSRRLAREMGGDVLLKTTSPGMGSTFAIHIEDRPHESKPFAPKTRETPIAATESMLPLQPGALRGVQVLLVDDAPDNLELIEYHLTKLGARVTAASNGLEGYQHAVEGHFDIVLMDLQMPVMDGYTATQKLRSGGFKKPIIALTAHAMTEIRQRCLDVGCTDHMPKPIDFNVLARKIERFVKIGREQPSINS